MSASVVKKSNGVRIRTIPAGFSLVELLIVMVITTVVGMAGFSLYQHSNRSYLVREAVSEAQQNVRVAMERLAQDIRMAGFGLPPAPFSLTYQGQTYSAPVTPVNHATGADELTLLGIGHEAGILNQGGNACNGKGQGAICLEPTVSFFDADGFVADRRYINLGGIGFFELAESGQSQASGILYLESLAKLERDYPDGTPVYILQAIWYGIEMGGSPDCPGSQVCLFSEDLTGIRGTGPQVLAAHIEDIQFAYGVDANPRDGRVDDLDGDGGYQQGDFVPQPSDPSGVVAVRASIVARTGRPDPDPSARFDRICVEDRQGDPGCTGVVEDAYRRRLLTRVIQLRNPLEGI